MTIYSIYRLCVVACNWLYGVNIVFKELIRIISEVWQLLSCVERVVRVDTTPASGHCLKSALSHRLRV